jgi:septum formation protein
VRLVLASGSPRRAQLLDQLGLDFVVEPSEVDETRYPDESPAEYVERVARQKCLAVKTTGALVIAADTTVVHEGRVMGKPAHPEEARSMLRRLQGESHEVFTGVAVSLVDDRETQSTVDITRVEMLPMTENEIDEYVASGEPMGKAGAYALQGVGGLFVRSVDGSPFTVIGLPIHLLPRLIGSVGVRWTDFRSGLEG